MPPAFGTLTSVVAVLVGLASLLAGRRLFWLFVGATGFLAGFRFATDLLAGATPLLVLVIALAVGLIGALLATFLQRAAVFAAGLIAGGMLVVAVLRGLGVEAWTALLVGFFAGAVPGGILTVVLFDWALIFLSAIVGGVLVAQALPLRQAAALPVLIVLVVVGVVVQARSLRQDVRSQGS